MTFADLRAMAPSGYLQHPQRPAFHLLILCRAGTMTHTVDFQRYRLRPGRTVWLRPGQVQRFTDNAGKCAGDLVLFQPDFLLPNTRAARIANDRSQPVLTDPPLLARPGIDRARRELSTEYAVAKALGAAAARETEVLRHLLSVLILRVTCDEADAQLDGQDEQIGRASCRERV